MTEQVHGHEVMRMMVESNNSYNKESLREAIEEKFGAATKFYTCSASDMTADELIDFLDSRGKFLGQKDSFNTESSKICNH